MQGSDKLTSKQPHKKFDISLNERTSSIIVFSLFFSWLLAFPFEGQILYTLLDYYQIETHTIVFGAIAATFAGLFSCGFFVKNMKAAKRLMLSSILFCIASSIVFISHPPLFG